MVPNLKRRVFQSYDTVTRVTAQAREQLVSDEPYVHLVELEHILFAWLVHRDRSISVQGIVDKGRMLRFGQ
jgi:hypothetical protein